MHNLGFLSLTVLLTAIPAIIDLVRLKRHACLVALYNRICYIVAGSFLPA
jgi:hypothetical protein